MKYAATMVSSVTGLWFVLAMFLTSPCAGKQLSLYRVDGNEGNVKLHRAGHSSAPSNLSTIANESPQESYVKASVVHPTEKGAKYRSEEAKLQQERRLMFFRNLQMDNMSQSMSMAPEPAYVYNPPDALPTTNTWQVLNGALGQVQTAQTEGAYIDPATDTNHDAELLDVLVARAEAFAKSRTGTEVDVRSGVLDETDEEASPSVQDEDTGVDEDEGEEDAPAESEQVKIKSGDEEEEEVVEEEEAEEVVEEEEAEASPPVEIKSPQVQLRGGVQKVKGAKKAPKAKGKKGKKGKKHKKKGKKKAGRERQ